LAWRPLIDSAGTAAIGARGTLAEHDPVPVRVIEQQQLHPAS
jgi:hypothetical protein